MFEAVITNISELSPTVKGFSFEVDRASSGSSASFLAGQWVDFFIPGVDQGPDSIEKKNSLKNHSKNHLKFGLRFPTQIKKFKIG